MPFVAGALVLLLSACPSEHDPYTAAVERDAVALSADVATLDAADEAAIESASHERFDAAMAQLDRERRARAAAERASRSAQKTSARPPVVVSGDVWGALARCESGGNPRAIGGGGRYFGAFQFTLGTWRSIGMSGNPIDYPYETQLAAAQRLQARSGWGQWPHCSRRLGLR